MLHKGATLSTADASITLATARVDYATDDRRVGYTIDDGCVEYTIDDGRVDYPPYFYRTRLLPTTCVDVYSTTDAALTR